MLCAVGFYGWGGSFRSLMTCGKRGCRGVERRGCRVYISAWGLEVVVSTEHDYYHHVRFVGNGFLMLGCRAVPSLFLTPRCFLLRHFEVWY